MFSPSERQNSGPVLFMLQELQTGQMETRRMLIGHMTDEDRKFDDIAATITKLRADLTERQVSTSTQRARRSDAKLLDIDLSPLKIVMILVYFLSCVGFMIHNKTSSIDGLKYIFEVMSRSHWIAIGLFLGLSRLVGRTVSYEAKLLTYIIPVLGLWFWSMLFASSMIFSSLAGLTILYVIPIVIEFWILVQAFRKGRACIWRQ